MGVTLGEPELFEPLVKPGLGAECPLWRRLSLLPLGGVSGDLPPGCAAPPPLEDVTPSLDRVASLPWPVGGQKGDVAGHPVWAGSHPVGEADAFDVYPSP